MASEGAEKGEERKRKSNEDGRFPLVLLNDHAVEKLIVLPSCPLEQVEHRHRSKVGFGCVGSQRRKEHFELEVDRIFGRGLPFETVIDEEVLDELASVSRDGKKEGEERGEGELTSSRPSQQYTHSRNK